MGMVSMGFCTWIGCMLRKVHIHHLFRTHGDSLSKKFILILERTSNCFWYLYALFTWQWVSNKGGKATADSASIFYATFGVSWKYTALKLWCISNGAWYALGDRNFTYIHKVMGCTTHLKKNEYISHTEVNTVRTKYCCQLVLDEYSLLQNYTF